jgi:predicted nucleic acid-binding protein
MFCADSSSWIAYLAGEPGEDATLLDSHLQSRSLHMVPAVLAELLSNPSLPAEVEESLLSLPLLDLKEGFWERAGKTRASLLRRKYRPKLADTLIAQICIDHNLPLHTRDTDFRPFAKHSGLQLVLYGSVN